MEITINHLPKARPFVEKNIRYKGLYGGRGSGKSHFFAENTVLKASEPTGDGNGHGIVCVREIQKSLHQSAKKLIEDKIEEFGLSSRFNVQQNQIIGPYGNLIIFQGMQDHNSESIKSLEGYSYCWIEEAQSLSKRSLELLTPTIRKDDKETGWHSEIWASWNPRKEDDPIEVLFRSEDSHPDSMAIEINYMDNPWFPEVLRKDLEYDKRRDPEKYAHVWLGEYLRNSEARVFKNWTVEEFETHADATFRLGADWGFSVDPTVLIRCYIVGRTLFIDHEAYEVGCEIENIPLLFNQIPDSEKWPIVADSQRPDTIDYVRRHGYSKIYSATKGKGSIEDGIEWLKNYDIVVHPRCIHTIDELTLYSYKIDKDTGKVLPLLEDKNNHVIDALRYANEGYRRAKVHQPREIQTFEQEAYF